jgi:hypothetical protein
VVEGCVKSLRNLCFLGLFGGVLSFWMMKLNLGGPSPAPGSYHEEASGPTKVAVTVELSPGGEVLLFHVSSGETIAQIKKRVCDTQGLSYASLGLTTDGVKMMDPLSLNDVKQIRGKTAVTFHCDVKQ